MADKIVNLHIDPSTQLPIPERFVDNGDGTWSLKVNSAGGGGGGGPATIADGADVAQGATTDVAVTGDAAGTLSAKLRGLLKQLAIQFPAALGGHGALIVEGVASGTAIPVSAAALPLPTGASTAAKQPALGTAGTASADVLSIQGIASMTALKVDGSAVTQPVSAASLPLPSGAATTAKQPAIGTAGSASADVLSVQGIASMTALKTDGSGVTQPVSSASLPLPAGASTAAKQPALGAAGTASTDVLSVQGIASMTALKTDGSATTQPVSAASLPLPSGASTAAKQPALGTSGTPSADVLTVQGVTSMTALKVDGSGVTQPTSSASLPLPTGASTAAKQPTLGTAGSASADVLSVQGVASMTALKVDGSAVTQPISAGTGLYANGQSQLGVVLNGKRTTQTSYNNSVATPITAANVLGTAATPTVVAVTESGSTLANVAYFTAVSAGKNGMGNSPVSGISTTLTPTANQAIRMTVTQVANADYYDLFLSTASAGPLWVGRVTEAQRLAGNSIISTVGVVTGNAHNVANTVDIGIVGTGQATTQPNFSFNNGYLLSALPVINCVGYDWLHIWLKLVLDDLRTAPVVNLMPFFQSDLTSTDWFSGDIFQSAIGRAEGYTLNQLVSLEVSGHDAVILAVSTLTGQITGSNGLSISYQLS